MGDHGFPDEADILPEEPGPEPTGPGAAPGQPTARAQVWARSRPSRLRGRSQATTLWSEPWRRGSASPFQRRPRNRTALELALASEWE